MKRVFFLIVIVLFCTQTSVAQQSKDSITKPSFVDKLHFGGGLNLSISQNATTIGVSPSVLYEVTDKVGVGVSVSYMYSKWKYNNMKHNVIGGSAFVQYSPIKQVQLISEFEQLHIIRKDSNDFRTTYNVPALYLGAGYTLGKFSMIGFRYDVLWKEGKSVYREPFAPFVRIYF